MSDYYKKYYEENREILNAKARAKYAADPDKRKQEKREYYLRHRERILAKQNAYNAEHRDEINAKEKARRKANPEKYKEKAHEYYVNRKKKLWRSA